MLSSPDHQNENAPQSLGLMGGADGLGSLEKIRDILFGSYIREFDVRFQKLENRLIEEVERLRADLHAKIGSLEGVINEKEARTLEKFNHVGVQFDQTEEQRHALQTEMHVAYEKQQEVLDTVRAELEAQIAVTDEMFRELLQEQSEALFQRLAVQQRALEDTWDETRSQLENKKADRVGLARLFNHIAAHLIDPFEAERSLLYRPDWEDDIVDGDDGDMPEPIIEISVDEEEDKEFLHSEVPASPLPKAFDVDLALKEAMDEVGIEEEQTNGSGEGHTEGGIPSEATESSEN